MFLGLWPLPVSKAVVYSFLTLYHHHISFCCCLEGDSTYKNSLYKTHPDSAGNAHLKVPLPFNSHRFLSGAIVPSKADCQAIQRPYSRKLLQSSLMAQRAAALRPSLGTLTCGAQDGSVKKSTCSCRQPGFGSHWVSHTQL